MRRELADATELVGVIAISLMNVPLERAQGSPNVFTGRPRGAVQQWERVCNGMEVAQRQPVIRPRARKSLAHRVRQGVLTLTTIAVLALAVTFIEDRSRGMSPLTVPEWSETELHGAGAQGQRLIREAVDEVVDESRLHTSLFIFSIVGVVLLIVLSRT